MKCGDVQAGGGSEGSSLSAPGSGGCLSSGIRSIKRKIRWSRRTTGGQEADRFGHTHLHAVKWVGSQTGASLCSAWNAEEERSSNVGKTISEITH